MVGIYVSHNALQPAVGNSIFNKALPDLTRRVNDLLKDVFGDLITLDDRHEMTGRLHWFNDPTLRRKLNFLAESFGTAVYRR